MALSAGKTAGSAGIYEPALTATRRSVWLSALAVFLGTIAALWLANLAAFSLRPEIYRIDVGVFRDDFWLDRMHSIERIDDYTYRWTREDARMTLFAVQHGSPTLLEIHSGPHPGETTIELRLNGEPWVTAPTGPDPRITTVFLPYDAPNQIVIEMRSPPFQAPGDAREIGFILDAFTLRIIGDEPVTPAIELLLMQAGILLGIQLIVIRFGGGWRSQILIAIATIAGVTAVGVAVLPLSYVYLQRLAVAAAIMAGLTWGFLPLAERYFSWAGNRREIRILWGLMLVAITIRMTGVLYPSFEGQDVWRNIDRLNFSINGQHIIIGGSSEFADGQTIYPTGPYIAIMPLLILMAEQEPVMQGMLTMLDGFTAFFVGLLAIRLGGSQTAARLAIVLYAGSLTAFSAITFSFSAQIFGQWFTAPILLLLTGTGALDQPRRWFLAVFALAIGVFSHIGVAILGIAWFSALLGLMLLFHRRSSGLRWGMLIFGGMLLSAVLVLYSHIVVETLRHVATLFRGSGGDETGTLFKGATHLLWKGIRLAFTEAGVFLLPPALVLFFFRPPSRDALLLSLIHI